MKKACISKISTALILFILIPILSNGQEINPSQWPSLVGYWKFQDTSNLTMATVGNDLVLVGSHEWVPGAYHGDTAVSIGIDSYYKCYHQILPNGGGDSVNRYALMFDFLVPNFDDWHAFFQTDSTNMNDAECFIKAQDPGLKSVLGTATTGYTPDSISSGVWHRMVISVCLDSFYRYYLDGDLWLDGNMQIVDSRFALTPLLLFFADNTQEDDTIHIGSIAIFNDYLSDTEVALLGGLDPCVANPPVVDLGGNVMVCSSSTVTLDAGEGFTSYLWSTGDTTRQIMVDSLGVGVGFLDVYVATVNIHQCVAADTVRITFIDCSSVSENLHDLNFKVFPNPFADKLFLDLPDGIHHLRICNLSGQTVLTAIMKGNQLHQLDTRNLAPGMYTLILESSGQTVSVKIVK